MVSNNKRMKYAFENEVSTSEEDSNDTDTDYLPNNQNQLVKRKCNARSGRKPKCFTKNALLARENRLKKKMYLTRLEQDVTSLKTENKKLTKIVDSQSLLISDLKKQVKYFKSVIANSSDISLLIRNIHQSTGMSVSSSMDKTLSLKNVCVPKLKQPIGRKTAHPWDETNSYPSFPTPESNCMSSCDTVSGDDIKDILNSIPLDFPLDIPEDELMNDLPFRDDIKSEYLEVFNDHSYTAPLPTDGPDSDDNLDDVGVCLHVSKHRVSLEFCSSCSESATQAWPN